jgi:hypothetical protein
MRDSLWMNMYILIIRDAFIRVTQKVKSLCNVIAYICAITVRTFKKSSCYWIRTRRRKAVQGIPLYFYPYRLLSLLFVFSPALSQKNVPGTTIVVHITSDSIVVGADRRVLNYDGTDNTAKLCKIKQIGNVFFTMTGNVIKDKIGFNLSSIACGAWRGQDSVFTFIQQFDNDIIVPIRRMATERIRDTKNRDTVLCTIEFYCFEGDYAKIFMRSYRIREMNGRRALLVDSQKIFFSRTIRGYGYPIYAGESAAIVQYVNSHPSLLANNSSFKIVNTLLGVQSKRNSKMTYPPFDIVCIKPDNAYWFSQKAPCEPIKPYLQR